MLTNYCGIGWQTIDNSAANLVFELLLLLDGVCSVEEKLQKGFVGTRIDLFDKILVIHWKPVRVLTTQNFNTHYVTTVYKNQIQVTLFWSNYLINNS